VDIIEGVHDNSHNQVAFHTKAGAFPVYLCNETEKILRPSLGCFLDPSVNITGTILVHMVFWTPLMHSTDATPQQRNGNLNLVCDGVVNDNSGCGVLEWSRASYGEYFDSQGGGVFATKWDENEITACALEPIERTHDPGSHVGLRRVILSRCNSTGHSRWHTESIGVGYTGREAGADQLQPAKQLLHEYVHHLR